MGVRIQVTVGGASELDEALARYGRRLGNRVLRTALGAAGEVLEGEVKRRLKAGPLRESVQTTVVAAETSGEAVVDFKSPEQGFIARMVEFGHLEVSQGPGRQVIGHVPAHPFLRPAVDAAGEEAIEAFADVFRSELAGEGLGS